MPEPGCPWVGVTVRTSVCVAEGANREGAASSRATLSKQLMPTSIRTRMKMRRDDRLETIDYQNVLLIDMFRAASLFIALFDLWLEDSCLFLDLSTLFVNPCGVLKPGPTFDQSPATEEYSEWSEQGCSDERNKNVDLDGTGHDDADHRNA